MTVPTCTLVTNSDPLTVCGNTPAQLAEIHQPGFAVPVLVARCAAHPFEGLAVKPGQLSVKP